MRPLTSAKTTARSLVPLPKRTLSLQLGASPPRQTKERLVILGSGWAGYSLLRKVDKRRYDVTVISPSTYFAFTPLLASTAVGTLEFRCALEPVRSQKTTYLQAWVDAIDFSSRTLRVTPAVPYKPDPFRKIPIPEKLEGDEKEVAPAPASASGDPAPAYEDPPTHPKEEPPSVRAPAFDLEYDKLVVAVGSYSQTFGTPGVKEYANFLKTAGDSRAIRGRIVEVFELAAQPSLTFEQRRKLLSFVIVGGGPTGVEFAAELHDLLTSDFKRYYPSLVPHAMITIYDVAPGILGSFDEGLRAYAEEKFARDGVVVKGNRHVLEVGDGWLKVKEEGTVPFGLLVWSTGLAPNPLVQALDVDKHPKTGSVQTDNHLRLLDKDGRPILGVYAAGDCATIRDSPLLPATAQVAAQKAIYLSEVLNKQAQGVPEQEVGEFKFRNKGSMSYIGGWQALVDRTQQDVSGPKGGEAGRFAWLLWRSAYWTMTLSIRNKLTIPYFWFLNWIFGRDITKF